MEYLQYYANLEIYAQQKYPVIMIVKQGHFQTENERVHHQQTHTKGNSKRCTISQKKMVSEWKSGMKKKNEEQSGKYMDKFK